MPIPDFQSIIRPLLAYGSDGKERTVREAIDFLAEEFNLSDEDRKVLLPSGQDLMFNNRLRWAMTYLSKAGLIVKPRRGVYAITERGSLALKNYPKRIGMKELKQFPEYNEFKSVKSGAEETPVDLCAAVEQTPEETLAMGYERIREELAAELLVRMKESSPAFFEQLVVDLLVKMGYGGSREDAGKAVGKSGDEGIDGIIKEDRLGLDTIYLQAKRWEGQVGRPVVQGFVGALHGQKARKGVFITTSGFSHSAREYASSIENRVILIDGEQLADLMIDYCVGVSTVATYEVKSIDSDYFSEA